MGKRRSRGGRGGKSEAADEEGKSAKQPKKRYDAIEIETFTNPVHEAYYRAQGIVPDGEWAAFVAAMRRPLPITFRVNDMHGGGPVLIQQLRGGFGLGATAVGDAVVPPPSPIPWYPGDEAWYYGVARHELRKIGAAKEFRDWLLLMESQGAVNRQEAVSMLPPLFLDVQPHHLVVDMCAAPGSKTAQILTDLHRSAVPATGMVVANDVDQQRAAMLVHQLKRIPSTAMVVTSHAAQWFPVLHVTGPSGEYVPRLFDRVLCDVPCSGDGTMRKNFSAWAKWEPKAPNSIHTLQLMIASRGVALLKPGGLMVYSTCSLNPVEDEAVVAELLRRFPGQLELVETADKLPQLIRSPGLKSWKVSVGGQLMSKHAELPERMGASIKPSLFPPDDPSITETLPRCFRVLPHQQDTGGFFVAVLRKREDAAPEAVAAVVAAAAAASDAAEADAAPGEAGEAPMETEVAEAAAPEAEAAAAAPRAAGRPRPRGKPELPFASKFARVEEAEFEEIKAFYGLDDTITREHLLTASDIAKKVYFVTEAVGQVLLCPRNGYRFRVEQVGVRAFERHGLQAASKYRLSQEALGAILPHMSRRIIPAKQVDILRLLKGEVSFDHDLVDPETRVATGALEAGSVVFTSKAAIEGNVLTVSVCTMLTSNRALQVMVSKEDRQELLALLDPQAARAALPAAAAAAQADVEQ